MLEEIGNDLKILAGDIYLVLDLNKVGLPQTKKLAQEFLTTFMNLDGLIDLWRLKFPDTKRYTWRRTRPNLTMVRLEFFLISQALLQLVATAAILPSY